MRLLHHIIGEGLTWRVMPEGLAALAWQCSCTPVVWGQMDCCLGAWLRAHGAAQCSACGAWPSMFLPVVRGPACSCQRARMPEVQ